MERHVAKMGGGLGLGLGWLLGGELPVTSVRDWLLAALGRVVVAALSATAAALATAAVSRLTRTGGGR